MSSSATAQINVRLDRALKEAGDAELARFDISPSQMVRAVWEKLAQGGEESARLRQGVAEKDEPSPEYARKLAAIERFKASQQEFERKLTEMGLDLSKVRPMTREEMYEARYQYLLEKYGE